ncbi:sensor histidine kinase [Dactylosporangium sp. CS-033363]|uniref:sensor histidine kinase n=1 Tax=Dactylosporangium sp. CS-033363 TaxID=3239935 RepID=UPI003D8B3A64
MAATLGAAAVTGRRPGRPSTSSRGSTVDAVLAVLLALPALLNPPAGRALWVQAVILAGLVLPLLWRRRRPGAMTAVVLVAAWAGLLSHAWAERLPLAHLSMQIMLYTLIVRGRRRTGAAAAAAAGAFFTVWALGTGADAGWSVLTYALSLATVWLLAELVRARRAYVGAERRALVRAAAAQERARIARELHDVLSHSVSVMVVNAEGARLMRHTDPAVVDRTLDLVSTTGRAALADLRRLLTVMDGDARAPQDLHRLTDGIPGATLRITGSASGVPAEVVEQAYRIVQEALTNAVKYAGATADALVDLGEPGPGRVLRIEVRDAGARGGEPRLPSSGRGLAGMRERVSALGGTLDAGPLPEGGFRVLAVLPLVTADPQVGADRMG